MGHNDPYAFVEIIVYVSNPEYITIEFMIQDIPWS